MVIVLPCMDGYRFAGEIRKLPGAKSLVVAALSGWGQEGAREQSLRAGFDQFFIKALDADALEKLIVTARADKSGP